MSSNIQNFVRTTANTNRKDINKILEALQDLFAAPIEDEAAHERIAKRKHVKRLTESHTDGAPTQIITNTPRDKENFDFVRKKPVTVKSYPLIHTSNNFGGVTFPVKDTKHAGRIDFDGTGYITVANQTRLNITDKLSVAFWARFVGFTGSSRRVFSKGDGAPNPWLARALPSANSIFFRLLVNSTNEDITVTFTPNVWTHWVVAWDNVSNSMEVWKDKISQGTNTTSGNLNTNALNLGIGSRANGTDRLANTDRLAHLTILNNKVSQTWIDNHFDGLQDTSDGNDEILTIPFIGSEGPKPNATSGLCRST